MNLDSLHIQPLTSYLSDPFIANLHPWGRICRLENDSFGYLPISKCGSQTLGSFFANIDRSQSRSILDSGENNDATTLIAIRDPVRRFISAFIEYLWRATPNPLLFSRDVVVREKIYTDFMCLDCSSFNSLIFSFIEIIERHGFHDAHHIPQSVFMQIASAKNNGIRNAIIFDVTDIDRALECFSNYSGITSKYSHINVRGTNDQIPQDYSDFSVSPTLRYQTNTQINGDLDFAKVDPFIWLKHEQHSIKAKDGSLVSLDPFSLLNKSVSILKYPCLHPLAKIMDLPIWNGVAVAPSSSVTSFLPRLQRDLSRAVISDQSFIQAINSLYRDDFQLYQSIKCLKDGNLFARIDIEN